MACNASKTPLLKAVASRGFAAAGRSAEIQTTALKNKLVVATADSHSPLSKISIIFQAGSRGESYSQLGAAHVIRCGASLTTSKHTHFGLVSHLAWGGNNFSSSHDRETISLTVDVNKQDLEKGLKYLVNSATNDEYRSWDLKELYPQIVYETRAQSNNVRAIDLLHAAAYRKGLGNLLFANENGIRDIDNDVLQAYINNNFIASRAAIVGLGIDHQLLLDAAGYVQLRSGTGATVPTKFHSGNERVNEATEWATVAIGTEGAALSNPKEALAFAVLQQVAGVNGSSNSGLGKVVAGALGTSPHGVTALNASYTDGGIFGAVLVAEGKQIGKAIDAVVKALKAGNVSSGDLARGKEQLKTAVLEKTNTDEGLIAELGHQCAVHGGAINTTDAVAAIDALTSADVNAAAKKVASGKWSVGAVGNLGHVPYADQL